MSYTKRSTLILLWMAVAAIIIQTGCMKPPSGSHTSTDVAFRSPMDLLNDDLQNIHNFGSAGPNQINEKYNNMFTNVFGGNTSQDVMSFLNTRIKHYTNGEDASVSRETQTLEHKNWAQDPDAQKNMEKINARISAQNLGSVLWLEGLVNDVSVFLALRGRIIPVKNSRVGIMLVREGFEEMEGDIKLASETRQSIIMHEARHSDCPKKMSSAELAMARKATSHRDFMSKVKTTECTHLHVYCPAMHEFANLPACDTEPWGSYGVGALFALAASVNMTEANHEDAWQLRAVAVDSLNRILLKPEAVLQGEHGLPDMSDFTEKKVSKK